MTTERISCAPGNGNNEDLVAALEGTDLTDFLVFDGYTIEERAQRCRSCGLAALMVELRAFEPARAT